MTDTDISALATALRAFLDASDQSIVQDMLSLWPLADAAASSPACASSLPVLSFLDTVCQNAPVHHAGVAGALHAAASSLAWGQTYSEADLSRGFLDRYGWTMIVGPTAPIPSDRIMSGFLLLGPGVEYPYHKHSVEEIYKVVSGTASWRLGDDDWAPLPPGTVVHNPPWRAHGMRTDHDEPLLLAFLWRAGVVEKSVMV